MPTRRNDLDISVLISTYNRAESLHRTLESFMGLNINGFSAEFVVVDNNGADNTRQVVEYYSDKLPIHYIFEANPGKNCALNTAIKSIPLGRIIVFTDDDVEPQQDWLDSVVRITDRYSDYSLFGGKVYNIWPSRDIPEWVQKVAELGIAIFPILDLGKREKPFPPRRFPAGPNFWMRYEIFENGRSFDEHFGPRPKSRIFGSETSFAKKILEEGHRILYSPDSVVGHRIQPEVITYKGLKERACRAGRTIPNMWGLKPKKLYENHRLIWWLWRLTALVKRYCAYVAAHLRLSKEDRRIRTLIALKGIAYNIESMKIASRNTRKKQTG
ncbi:MAG: glycosyltransferase family 2 protein [Sedimentisphaerales bacterium]|nr:glycosyltransferase family 2 protein [Sedimentisphaerales bacterium]